MVLYIFKRSIFRSGLVWTLLILCLSQVVGQKLDPKGLWTGTLYQNPSYEFYFEIRVEESDASGNITGTTYIETLSNGKSMGNPGNNGTIEFRGKITGDTLFFQETEIQQEEITKANLSWCIKTGKLLISKDKQSHKYTLKGAWNASVTCKPGRIEVSKFISSEKDKTVKKYMKEFRNRGVKTVEKIEIKSDQVTIEIWDDQMVDGDTVSLFYDKNWLLKNYPLTKEKKIIKISSTGVKNTLILHAVNLGTIPPNTLSMIVDDGITRKKIVLHSSKSKSEALIMIRK